MKTTRITITTIVTDIHRFWMDKKLIIRSDLKEIIYMQFKKSLKKTSINLSFHSIQKNAT
jgi:hypothetical protein